MTYYDFPKRGNPLLSGLEPTKRKVFISFFQGDRTEVDAFIYRWTELEKVFIPKALGTYDNEDFIESDNPAYVMQQIREKYLQDSTVTIVLVGACTHSRRYVDWELKTSLRRGQNYTPNGVIGIILPSSGKTAFLPPRLEANWTSGHVNCYARYWIAPASADSLRGLIEDAHAARTGRVNLIQNDSDMMKHNSKCRVHGLTH
ncbi:MAG: TIR domain-containing protein [Acidobacteria bacterium]|nr:TIR domain-containing protein [Acidobacteriota bacterium]